MALGWGLGYPRPFFLPDAPPPCVAFRPAGQRPAWQPIFSSSWLRNPHGPNASGPCALYSSKASGVLAAWGFGCLGFWLLGVLAAWGFFSGLGSACVAGGISRLAGPQAESCCGCTFVTSARRRLNSTLYFRTYSRFRPRQSGSFPPCGPVCKSSKPGITENVIGWPQPQSHNVMCEQASESLARQGAGTDGGRNSESGAQFPQDTRP